jgi:hypothetical protein
VSLQVYIPLIIDAEQAAVTTGQADDMLEHLKGFRDFAAVEIAGLLNILPEMLADELGELEDRTVIAPDRVSQLLCALRMTRQNFFRRPVGWVIEALVPTHIEAALSEMLETDDKRLIAQFTEEYLVTVGYLLWERFSKRVGLDPEARRPRLRLVQGERS